MEPMPPELREELKAQHPGLTDEDIDRYEQLTSQRAELDPITAAPLLRQVDEQRMRLVTERMPRLAAVENDYLTDRARAAPPEPEVEYRRPPEDQG